MSDNAPPLSELHDCPAGGPHTYKFASAADQQDDSGRRFHDGWFCSECGATPPRLWQCLNCGDAFTSQDSGGSVVYCSSQCLADGLKEEKSW